jgi:hypothetical protein
VFATGRLNGVYEFAARKQDGRDVGAVAAAFARGETRPHQPSREHARQVSHLYPVFAHSRGRNFVDLDEDIQVKDLLASVQEGYDSLELMKRFSTLGMGPSQGKHSNIQGANILLRARGKTFADTALTTQRPFYHPVPLKHLAGRGFHLTRRSAAHDRHAALGAHWMTVGGWQRPQYYARGSSAMADCIAAEVRAVRDHAGLIDRGGGLIYDDVKNLTWMQDTHYAFTSGFNETGLLGWEDANAFAKDLEFYDRARDVTWSDWRMPSIIIVPPPACICSMYCIATGTVCSFAGTARGANCSACSKKRMTLNVSSARMFFRA